MTTPEDYLQIPEDYSQAIGGLRWSSAGDAIEFPSGETLVFSRALGLFIEGFTAQHELIHFAHVVHLAHILLNHSLLSDLTRFRSYRNAGALCGVLSNGVPRLPDPPDLEQVRLMLSSGVALAGFSDEFYIPKPLIGEVEAQRGSSMIAPTMNAIDFEHYILERLSRLSHEEIHCWFRTGRAPDRAGEVIAERVTPELPRLYGEVMEPILKRSRFHGAASVLERLVGALSLPPRRLSSEVIPAGGYADIANRGHPERLLPSQHAIDSEEFLRRFAEHELLYFHREEPRDLESEELVVVLDQGVRTWGIVRPILAAASVALGKLADRRKATFRIATTSRTDHPIDPLEVTLPALTELLEASDLTTDPSDGLARIIESPRTAQRRDLMLLTHPRCLRTPEVLAVAAGVPQGDRLFALTVDDHYDAQLLELKRGSPVPLLRFRVTPQTTTESIPSRLTKQRTRTTQGWSGDVEPIGFPFRFIPSGRLAQWGRGPWLAFDEGGGWLLAIGPYGIPIAWSVDGKSEELWPRGYSGGSVVARVNSVLGVAGGFVVIGSLEKNDYLAIVSYELLSREVRTYVINDWSNVAIDWFYLATLHAVVGRTAKQSRYINLRTGEFYRSDSDQMPPAVALSLARIRESPVPPPEVQVLHDDDTKPTAGPLVRLHRKTGTLHIDGIGGCSKRLRMLSDGQPVLEGCRLNRAFYRAQTLAIHVSHRSTECWYIFEMPELIRLADRPGIGLGDLGLSADGRLVGIRQSDRQFAAYQVDDPGPPLLSTPRGGPSGRATVILGRSWMAIESGDHTVHLRWGSGELQVSSARKIRGENNDGRIESFLGEQQIAETRPGRLPNWADFDPQRFRTSCRGVGLVVVADVFAQVIVSDASENLICMFYTRRDRIAGWMPDGTRYGPPELLQDSPTPGASRRIAEVLQQATARS